MQHHSVERTRRQSARRYRAAAERAWDAAHGDDIHYMVGKEAERARFFARFFPGMMRNQIKRQFSSET